MDRGGGGGLPGKFVLTKGAKSCILGTFGIVLKKVVWLKPDRLLHPCCSVGLPP